MKYLIVGLGNIGDEYYSTRHNIGFDILDYFATKANVSFSTARYGDIATLRIKGRNVTLLKPSTYMNLSGNAVRYWMQKEGIKLENVLIITDDVALPLGKIRFRPQGSDAGHNGLKHIIEILGTNAFSRFRFGIGNDYPRGHQVDYVLGKWTEEEKEHIKSRYDICIQALQHFVLMGTQSTMNTFNNK